MTEVHFHYCNAAGASVERCTAIVNDFADTRAYAELFVRSLLMTPGLEDWRGWTLHVRDELGTPILDLPFASLLGKPH